MISLCLWWATAWAQEPAPSADDAAARGKELYENGVILYDEGRYEDAILAWQEGYRLTQRSGFLFNIANAQERIGDYRGAIDTLGRYRALARAEERETLDRRIRSLEDRMLATQASPAPQPAPAPQPVALPPEPTRRGPRGTTVVGGSLVGVGALGLGVGTAFGVQSRSARAEAEASCATVGGTLLCPSSARDALDAEQRGAVVADLGVALGAAMAAGGVLLLVIPSGGEDPVALSVRPGGVELVVSGF